MSNRHAWPGRLGHDTTGLGHDTAKDSACDTTMIRKGERRAREGLASGGVCRDTINCIVTGGRLGRWVIS